MRRVCRQTMPDGRPCRANAVAGSRFCFFHDPGKEADRLAAQRAGGSRNKAASLPADTPDVKLTEVKDIVALLGSTINQVRRGELDVRIGNAVGYLSGVLLKAVEIGDLEQRVSDLEAVTRSQCEAAVERELEQFEFVSKRSADMAVASDPEQFEFVAKGSTDEPKETRDPH